MLRLMRVRLLFSLALGLSLVGCGGGSNLPNDGSNSYGVLEIVRLNGSDEEGRGQPTYVCPNEIITLQWYGEPTSYFLDISPSYAASPAVDYQRFSAQAELQVEISQDAVAVLFNESGQVIDYRELELIPAAICNDFPIPLLGEFTGVMTQTKPVERSLERRLSLEWKGSGLGLQAKLLGGEQSGFSLESCTPDVAAQRLICTQGLTPIFEFIAEVTSEGLTGQYKGVATDPLSSSPLSGTFNFKAP